LALLLLQREDQREKQERDIFHRDEPKYIFLEVHRWGSGRESAGRGCM
jgi:hypothetical protein